MILLPQTRKPLSHFSLSIGRYFRFHNRGHIQPLYQLGLPPLQPHYIASHPGMYSSGKMSWQKFQMLTLRFILQYMDFQKSNSQTPHRQHPPCECLHY